MATTTDFNQKLAELNKRAIALGKTRDAKLREAAQQEQRRDQALDELEQLGYPQARDMKTKDLAALRDQIESELVTELDEFEHALQEGEALVEEQA
jgi:hypothetical protein